MGIKSLVTKAGGFVADGVAKAASLSPAQLEEVEERRKEYLTQMPSLDDERAVELTSRLLASCGIEIHNAYLPQIASLYTPLEAGSEYERPFDPAHNIRFFEITKWVTDSEENSLEKLVNVYDVLADGHCNIALVFNRGVSRTQVYLAVVDTNNSPSNIDVNEYRDRLLSGLQGNFPGSVVSNSGEGRIPCLADMRAKSVACVSNVPAEKSEKFVSQTIEKLLDGIVPTRRSEEYTLLLLATPVQDVEERKLRLCELYTALAPYAGWQTNFTHNESDNASSSATLGFNVGASVGTQTGVSSTVGTNEGVTDSSGSSVTDSAGTNRSFTRGRNRSTTAGVSTSQNVSAHAGVGATVGPNVGGSVSVGMSESLSTTGGTSSSTSVATNTGHAVARTLGRAVMRGLNTTQGVTRSLGLGVNYGLNFARSSTVTVTVGKSEGVTQSFVNQTIKHALEHLESQLKRYDQASALGMWDFAAYVTSDSMTTASNVAHAYLSLTQGEESYLSQSAINTWRGDMGDRSGEAHTICQYLCDLRHPLFALDPHMLDRDLRFAAYPATVSATTVLSGKELAYSLNFPRKSVPGLPVIECAEFGRSVSLFDGEVLGSQTLRLGNVFHMHREERVPVLLAKDSLASHTFVTGSTGAGKTNAVVHLLDEARESGVGFLVIEPAKGEYKDILGCDDEVSVFGTNPALAPLLRIDPFSFPAGIHVLEHLDRLVEIFNACWPMFAAMPAVLKDAIERSYVDCGWDLVESSNEYGEGLYPNLADVARNVRQILDSSEYDAENKGAYKGSLLTRLGSLTNGINGLILTSDELDGAELFDGCVVVDLSRVGSSETKSLLMGLLVLKLQEYRMAEDRGANQALRHLTVLEEAHNLLRRTSSEQLGETANLQGKSVEMLANAIAEMRTYGEGFVIADQAPGLLDMAVIRNTNTKVIMRVPDLSDRELVGRAASLNDKQIAELARLPRGVAAVYQNEWVEPVLCKVDKADEGGRYRYERPARDESTWRVQDALTIADLLSHGMRITEQTRLHDIDLAMRRLSLGASERVSIYKLLNNPLAEPKMTKLAPIMSGLFPMVYQSVAKSFNEFAHSPDIWTKNAATTLAEIAGQGIDDQVKRDIVQAIITNHIYLVQKDAQAMEDWQNRGGLRWV